MTLGTRAADDKSDDASEKHIPHMSAISNDHHPPPTASSQDDGIYNIRSRPSGFPQNRLNRASSLADMDDDPNLHRESDFKTAQVFQGRMLLWLAYQSIGVIYGDIGTSPLYVYSATFTSEPTYKDLIGVLSIILWSLIWMVTLKYVMIILRADNDGEGGTFSTYALLSRYLNITNRDPREASFLRLKRHMSGELQTGTRALRKRIESSRVARGILQVVGILAVTMVIADGVLTPAQSVLGAIQGIEVVSPNVSKSTVIGASDAILILLFLIQPLGISKITILFSPIVIIWLGFNAVFGVYNLARYDTSVLKAFNPGYAFTYLVRHKTDGWLSLGGILLAFTGVEALFADLGAFSRRAVQLSWLCYTFPCLLLAYTGQAAFISVHPEAYSNPFFNAAPRGTIYPALIIAILAAIVASQAIITATFQLLSIAMKLSYFPQLKVIHTSTTFHGQLYIPLANWLLMVGTVLVASLFKNTTALGQAYGVCVMFVTFFDTCMVSLAAIFVWKIAPYYVVLPWLALALFDGAFLSSALTKVPKGAWFTLMLAGVLACVFLLWRFGKEQQWTAERDDRRPTSHFVSVNKVTGELSLSAQFDGTPLSTFQGLGIFFDKAGDTTPLVFSQFVLKLTATPQVMVLFHLRPLETPSVPYEERYSVSRLAIPNCYRLVLRCGYNDEVISPDLASVVFRQIKQYLVSHSTPTYGADRKGSADMSKGPLVTDVMTGKSRKIVISPEEDGSMKNLKEMALNDALTKLEQAFSHKVSYIIGKESMRVEAGTNFARKLLLDLFLWMRENSRTKMSNFRIPPEKLIEVGFLKNI